MRWVRSIAMAMASVGAVLAVGASAAAANEFVASQTGTLKLSGGTQTFEVGAASERLTIECAKVTGQGSITELKSVSQQLTASFEKCDVAGTKITASTMEFELGAAKTFALLKRFDLEAGTTCKIEFEPSSPLKGVTYKNHDGKIEVTVAVDELPWEGSGSVAACDGSGTNGVYDGSFTLEDEAAGSTYEWA